MFWQWRAFACFTCVTIVQVTNDVVQAIPSLATSFIPTSSNVEKTKFCWGDLENDEPLGIHFDINSASSWYDEAEAPLNYEILKTILKTHSKNLKSNQIQTTSLDRYFKRVRIPTVRLNLWFICFSSYSFSFIKFFFS